MSADPSLLAQARAWLADDPDPDTRTELEALLDGDEEHAEELAQRFSGRLQFGTAGLRGELGAGPMRMNRVTVRPRRRRTGRATSSTPCPTPPSAASIIGYDARKKSDVFALDTAQVFAGAGVRSFLLPRPLPTPVAAFGITYLGTAAGVVVTASHNPPRDNGYKVYLGDSAQIVSPHDVAIAAADRRRRPPGRRAAGRAR